jgi:hypothetical protein
VAGQAGTGAVLLGEEITKKKKNKPKKKHSP